MNEEKEPESKGIEEKIIKTPAKKISPELSKECSESGGDERDETLET